MSALEGPLIDPSIRRPGFGLPLKYIPHGNDRLFPNALDADGLLDGEAQLPFATLREFTMLHFMNKLTDKPNWHKKVFDETIISEWKLEALSEGNDTDMTERMVDWCLSELQCKAGIFEKTGAVTVYDGDVVKSDTSISESLRTLLKAAAAPLENVSEREKDWHPGSDNMVLDLVHPSLYPLVYGYTRALPDGLVSLGECIELSGTGITVELQPDDYLYHQDARQPLMIPFSEEFQWLPCDIDISGGQGHVRITSYINNLHPEQHRPLYLAIEQIISRTIPLWNMTLTSLQSPSSCIRRIEYSMTEYKYKPGAQLNEEPQPQENESTYIFNTRKEAWQRENSEPIMPEPRQFSSEKFAERSRLLKSVDLWNDFADRGLQIIVKLANIHLTPEKHEYRGGSWHVEGQLNEHICASAVYYYDNNNIITSRLAFRQKSNVEEAMDINYAPNRRDWLEAVFGCQPDSPAVQDIGTVDTTEGRLLTWPNILERQVQPFELLDRTQPGHQKILALFLVDPHIQIISTANVPCEQFEWWKDAVLQGQRNPIASLPVELQEHIFDDVEDYLLGLEEAKELRLELMKEREAFRQIQNTGFQYHKISFPWQPGHMA